MVDCVVVSDNIQGKSKDNALNNDVVSALEKAGHTAFNQGVGPNVAQTYGLSGASQGKTLVFILGGVGTVTAGDFYETNYKYDRVIFCHTGWVWSTQDCSAMTKTVNEWDWNRASSFKAKWSKYSMKQICEMSNGRLDYMCSMNREEFIKKVVAKVGGKSTDDDDSGGSASTIKDALKQLLSYWDGEVECRLEGNKVYVNKIPAPTDELELIEGVNLVADSLSIHDYFPDTVNFLTVHWEGGEDIIFRDEKLIARFGEKPLEMDAVKKVTVTEEEEVESTETTDDETGEETETTTETKTVTKTEEVPITDPEEAQTFAETEWAKIRREDGHSIECKVIASSQWKQGKWCKVNIPSMNEDMYMYVTKVSHSDSGESDWNTNITLVDYPPGFGEYQEEDSSDEEDEETEEEETTEEE